MSLIANMRASSPPCGTRKINHPISTQRVPSCTELHSGNASTAGNHRRVARTSHILQRHPASQLRHASTGRAMDYVSVATSWPGMRQKSFIPNSVIPIHSPSYHTFPAYLYGCAVTRPVFRVASWVTDAHLFIGARVVRNSDDSQAWRSW